MIATALTSDTLTQITPAWWRWGCIWYVFAIVSFAAAHLSFIKYQQVKQNPERDVVLLLLMNSLSLFAFVLLFEFWLKPDLRSHYDAIFGASRVGGITGVLLYAVPDGVFSFVCACFLIAGVWLIWGRNSAAQVRGRRWFGWAFLAFGLCVLALAPIVLCAPFF
jgi:hypothetical protein